MTRRPFTVYLLTLMCFGLLLSPLAAGETENAKHSMATALSGTHRFTVTLMEGGESNAFSMTVASRRFAMNIGEKNIALTGRLEQQPGGREMLDYSIEFTQWFDVPEGGRIRRGSTWEGGAYLTNGKPVEVVRFLNGFFTLQLDTID